MADYHFIYKDVEGATTQWDDIHVGDWTSGTSSYPRKCSLTLLQGSNERRVSVPEGDEGSFRSTCLKTKTFGDNLRWAKETNRRSGAKGLRARPSALTFGRRR